MSSTSPNLRSGIRGGHGIEIFITEAVKSLGDDIARQHGVDRDGVFCKFDAGRAHEADLRRFAGTVVTPAGEAGQRSR